MLIAHSTADGRKHPYCCMAVFSSNGWANLGQVEFSIFSVMTAGNFFKGLEYRKADAEGRRVAEFRKDGRIVAFFPDKLDIIVDFDAVAGPKVKPSRVPSLAEVDELSRSIQLDASWKSGVELRPAELIGPPLTDKPTPSKYGVSWTCSFQVRAKSVPLTEHLVVSVLGPHKEFLGRVTFDLTSDLIPPPGPTK